MEKLLKTAWGFVLEIGTAFANGVWTYAELREGIEGVVLDSGGQNQQYFFLKNNGFAANEVNGLAPKLTISGKRVYGDAAQDYIDGLRFQLGSARKTSIRLRYVDSSSGADITRTIVCGATIQDIVTFGGQGVENAPFNCVLALNGAPVESTSLDLPELTVVSVAGVAGKTAIYVNPAKAGGNTYVYKTDDTVELPALGAATTGWTAWDGSAEITATTADQIGIVEVDGTGLAVKGGLATVTAG